MLLTELKTRKILSNEQRLNDSFISFILFISLILFVNNKYLFSQKLKMEIIVSPIFFSKKDDLDRIFIYLDGNINQDLIDYLSSNIKNY